MPDTRIPVNDIEIVRGNQPDVIKSAVEMQSRYYTRTPGFNQDYETQLASGLAKLEPRISGERSEVWTAKYQVRIVGTIFVDGEDLGQNHARLTSFIVDEGFRGGGIGRRLLTEAIKFVDGQRFEETRLWTFEGSDAARRLYESFGFVLEKQFVGEYFSKELTVQLFIRKFQNAKQP